MSQRSATTSVHVALLRGINVGGKNKLPMSALVEIFVEAGCSDVRTFIQSGNVVFRAAPPVIKRLPRMISTHIAHRLGLQVPVLLRSADELCGAEAANPFLRIGADPNSLHVAFLADPPDRPRVDALDANRSPGDSFEVRGREIYLHLPNGMARTKLTNAYFDSKLATVSTVRNWRTVLKLVEMTRSG